MRRRWIGSGARGATPERAAAPGPEPRALAGDPGRGSATPRPGLHTRRTLHCGARQPVDPALPPCQPPPLPSLPPTAPPPASPLPSGPLQQSRPRGLSGRATQPRSRPSTTTCSQSTASWQCECACWLGSGAPARVGRPRARSTPVASGRLAHRCRSHARGCGQRRRRYPHAATASQAPHPGATPPLSSPLAPYCPRPQPHAPPLHARSTGSYQLYRKVMHDYGGGGADAQPAVAA